MKTFGVQLQMNQQKSTKKSKNTILNFLPRATSSVSFQNPPIYSPSKHKSHIGIGFSGPLLSTISGDHPHQNIKNRLNHTVQYEPTSPRVSCMGHVKCKYTKHKPQLAGATKLPTAGKFLRLISATPERARDVDDGHVGASKNESKSKKKLGFKKLFSGVLNLTSGSGGRRKQDGDGEKTKIPVYVDKLSGLDWTRESVVVDSGDRSCDSDEDDVIMPSSAPVVIRNIPVGFDEKVVRGVGNMEPRKEINLWKRRTMTQPKPLLLHDI